MVPSDDVIEPSPNGEFTEEEERALAVKRFFLRCYSGSLIGDDFYYSCLCFMARFLDYFLVLLHKTLHYLH